MKVVVAIPAYKGRNQILDLINSIQKVVSQIYMLVDICLDYSGKFLSQSYFWNRLYVIFSEKNSGLSSAFKQGYEQFIRDDSADIIAKLDGDGQIDSELNQGLMGSTLMDPIDVLNKLELGKIDNQYYFESNMLFRLSLLKARVMGYPLHALYVHEERSSKISRIMFRFPLQYVISSLKRIGYNCFLHDFNAGSLQLFMGLLLFIFGVIFGVIKWINSGIEASAGTIMLSALPVILVFQLLLEFLNYDIESSKN